MTLQPADPPAAEAESPPLLLSGLHVVLISTYEMGRQPFGLASPAAWLRERGAVVTCLDLSRDRLDRAAIQSAQMIGWYLPMHTATRLAGPVIDHVRQVNPTALLCAYGLYAPLNREWLRQRGVATVVGGEFEAALVVLAEQLAGGVEIDSETKPPAISLDRLTFRIPDRRDLPSLSRYAALEEPAGRTRVVGYTEASRGCKHLCRHCPVVPVYEGRFRIVSPDVVLEDIANQVDAGAEHITFGDPDFFNGIKHATEIVRRLSQRFPRLTYDVTIKVEHLLKHRDVLPVLHDTGCAFVTSAVESFDDHTLARLAKQHTRTDVVSAAAIMREHAVPLVPTFVAFTPWTTLSSYADLLATIAELDWIDHVAPVQLAIRLLIPSQSKLLELSDIQALVEPFDDQALTYHWRHPDPRVDALQRDVERLVRGGVAETASRAAIFGAVVDHVATVDEQAASRLAHVPRLAARSTVPYLTEPWFC